MARHIDLALSDAGLPALQRHAWVEVDIDIQVANAGALASLARPAALGAVVKADGYGHGLEIASRAAVAGGAKWLCVADSGEATRLREDGYEGRVFVLYPVPAAMVPHMAESGVDVTVGSVAEAQTIGEQVDGADTVLAVHVEIDTGMTRGGVLPGDALEAARAIAGDTRTDLAGVWTHLAAPESPETIATQLGRFREVLERLSEAGIQPRNVHAAASGGLLASDTSTHDLVRPGLVYYGLHPHAGDPLPGGIAPALAVKAHPVRIADVGPGTSVGYAGTWTATRDSRIATLPIGYADGWSRSSSPGTRVLVEGESAPLVGRVSSDAITVDVTGIDGVGSDSEFTLLGRARHLEISADEVAMVRNTISWEVLQQLGSRLTRVYRSGGDLVAMRAESTTSILTAPGATIPHYRPDRAVG